MAFNVEVARAQEQPSELKQSVEVSTRFRVERTTIASGGELLTIWAQIVGGSEAVTSREGSQGGQTEEIPLLSVLRDTLADANRENDVLGEVWVHTYASPKLIQRAAALVPFLYKGLRVKPHRALTSPPPAIINLSDTGQQAWQRLFISGVTNVAGGHPLFKASVHNYQRNITDYRRSNLMRALTILSLYARQPGSDSPFSEAELIQVQSQLSLEEKTFGGLVDKIHLRNFYEKDAAALSDTRGHNWELLRQQAEASGLSFEPLFLSDKTVTHALIWFPADGLNSKDSKVAPLFQGRFLNIKNPWRDKRLREWKGYTETRYFNLGQPLSANQTTGPVTEQ